MHTNKIAWLALAVALVALGLVFGRPFSGREGTVGISKETAFERVMRTRTLRCAYAVRPPFLVIDPATNQKSGISYDVMEAIGKIAHLKIEWNEEVGYGVFPEQLKAGKEDAFCLTLYKGIMRAQRVEMTTPVVYSPIYAFVRAGDTRFDGALGAINDEQVTIAALDGTPQKDLAESAFPRAKKYLLAGETGAPDVLLALVTGKADVYLSEQPIVLDYNAKNPDKPLKRVAGVPSVRVFGEAFSVAKGESELRDFLNTALQDLQNDGTLERILSHYVPKSDSAFYPATPYVVRSSE